LKNARTGKRDSGGDTNWGTLKNYMYETVKKKDTSLYKLTQEDSRPGQAEKGGAVKTPPQ